MQTGDETSKSNISQVLDSSQGKQTSDYTLSEQPVVFIDKAKVSSKHTILKPKGTEFLFYLIPKQVTELSQLLNAGHQLIIELRADNDKKIAVTRIDRKTQVHGGKQGTSRYFALKLRVPDIGKPAKLILKWYSSSKWLLDFCYLRSENYE